MTLRQEERTNRKTREVYLVEFEAKLLEILNGLYKSVNYNLTITFCLSILMFLTYSSGSVIDISFLGIKITLKRIDMLIYIPILTSFIYFLINYQLHRIANVYTEINKNADELVFINSKAKPITMRNIHLFGAGATGLILSLARWQANRLLENNPFKSPFQLKDFTYMSISWIFWELLQLFKKKYHISQKDLKEYPRRAAFAIHIERTYALFEWGLNICSWAIVTFFAFSIIVSLFLLPIGVMGYFEYIVFFGDTGITSGWPLLFLSVLIVIASYTFYSGLMLFITYSVDLLETLKTDFAESTNEFKIIDKLQKFVNRFRRKGPRTID